MSSEKPCHYHYLWMQRKDLNIFLDGLLSLAPDQTKESRQLLIELAEQAESHVELLSEWLSFHDLWKQQILEVKVWMGLSYFQLSQLYHCSPREVGRLLRARRSEILKPYPQVGDNVDLPNYGGLSCFMVEKHLSLWVDAEWESTSELSKIQSHLHQCSECRDRLDSYRRLNKEILSKRRSYEVVSQAEWEETLSTLKIVGRERRIRFALGFIFVIFVFGVIFMAMKAQPEKMPNIYEIDSQYTE